MDKDLSDRYNDGILPAPELSLKARPPKEFAEPPSPELVALARRRVPWIIVCLVILILACSLAVLALAAGWVG